MNTLKTLGVMLAMIIMGLAHMATARAEVSEPIDVSVWNGKLVWLDTNTCTLASERHRPWPATDPDTYDCDDACGIIPPGLPSNLKPLLEVPAQSEPDYDSHIASVREDFIICGPDTGTCYDPGCNGVETDMLKGVWVVEPLSEAEMKLQARNEAATQFNQNINDALFKFYSAKLLGMLLFVSDSQTLPPKWQTQWDAAKTWIQDQVVPIDDRLDELLALIAAGTIQGGDMDQGWPAPSVLGGSQTSN